MSFFRSALVAPWLLLACGKVSPGTQDAAVQDDAVIQDAAIDGAVATASCANLAASCGPTGTASCCEKAAVLGGTFFRNYDGVGFTDMSFPATVNTFTLDKYEVTVSRFRKFVDAGMGTQAHPPDAGSGAHANLAGSGWDSAWNTSLVADTAALKTALRCGSYQSWTDTPGANEDHPIDCVSWYEAMAFCIWDGGYLPTEAQWNYAASGGSEQRVYAWSSPATSGTIDCSYANYNVNSPAGTFCVNGTVGGTNRVGSESPKGDGRWGHADLAGNVWEWTLDRDNGAPPQPCDDCANLTTGTNRLFRGGAFGNVAGIERTANRIGVSTAPVNRGDLGVRCARPQ